MRKLLILATVVGLILALVSSCQKDKALSREEGKVYLNLFNKDNKVIFQYDKNSKTILPYFTVPSPDKCWINKASMDPMDEIMAASCYCSLLKEQDCGDEAKGYYIIYLLDISNKNIIAKLKHGFGFSFSPGGDSIVYDTTHFPGEDAGCKPPSGYEYGIWTYNIRKKMIINIDTINVNPLEYAWSEHDGNIYITDRSEVVRYNVAEARSEKVDIKAIHYSPDGKYYFGVVDPIIFRVADNQPMREWNDKIKKEYGGFNFVAWVLGGRAMLLYIHNSQSYLKVVFDMEQGEVIQKFSGGVRGCNHAGTECMVMPLIVNEKGWIGTKNDAIEIVKIKDPRHE